MSRTRRTFLALVVGATASVVALTSGAAQAGSGKDTAPQRVPAVQADDRQAPDRVGGPKVTVSPAARSAKAKIQKRIADYVAKNGTAYSFATYLDVTTGKLVVESDAPADLVATLTNLSGLAGVSSAERQEAGRTVVRQNGTSDNFHRRDDVPAYWGGGGITSGGGICSSGYAVRNSAGTVFMTTAGHCFANGATVLTESGANTYGVVSNRNLPPINNQPRDVELIGSSSYAGRIFTGGITSSTSVPVYAAGEAFEGFADYCHSGRTTGENCGHTAVDIDGQVCTQTGCKSPVIVFNGGTLSQGGDSGSPFYVMDTSGRAWIRGHVIAGSSTTAYAEKWTAIAPLLGVTIVTGA